MRCALLFIAVVLVSSCSHLPPRAGEQKVPAVQRAAAAWHRLAAGEGQGSGMQATVAAYDRAVAEVVRLAVAQQAPDRWGAMVRLADGSQVRIDAGDARSHQRWSPRLFDSLHERRHPVDPPGTGQRMGLGAAFDGVHEHDEHEPNARFVYGKGQHVPVTAVLDFSDGAKAPPVLRLYDPREVAEIPVGRHRQPLAADFALPVQNVLKGQFFLAPMVEGLFRPERFQSNQGLYLLEPYRADKVPVIFVHGLMSDPHIWETEVLQLMSDPQIASRVQCWCFMYPTGLPVISSAARLRAAMADARKTFDPGGRDPGFERTVMIGHSMGGLLTRMQVENSGDTYWRTWFSVAPEKLQIEDHEVSQALIDGLIFKANPQIKDVVFIATPHRGSSMADTWYGRFGAWLIRTPKQVVQVATSIATLDVAMLAPERVAVQGFSLESFGLNSVSTLSPHQPFYAALNSCPMTAPCHSVIGNLGRPGPLALSSDGVVPYTSSHLDQAVSEKVVPYWHGCVQQVECADEVTRIVREHLRLSAKPKDRAGKKN